MDIDQGINPAIRKIRRALGDDAEAPRYLQTVVGRGCHFIAPEAVETGGAEGFLLSAEGIKPPLPHMPG